MPNQQKAKFKHFPLGFEFIPNDTLPRLQGPKERMEKMGKNTCHLFLYAIETSGSGPPTGIMNLDENNKTTLAGGIAAFLRAVERHLPKTFVELDTIGERMKRLKMNHVIGRNKPEYESTTSTAYEKDIEICKVPVNPMLILLHVDQGSFADGRYTPFATPRSNNRSIHEENVQKLTAEILRKENVVKMEDFSIVPYMVHLENTLTAKGTKTREPYRCTLDRYKQSEHLIIAKEAQTITSTQLKLANEVSQKHACGFVLPKKSEKSSSALLLILAR